MHAFGIRFEYHLCNYSRANKKLNLKYANLRYAAYHMQLRPSVLNNLFLDFSEIQSKIRAKFINKGSVLQFVILQNYMFL